MGRTYLLRLTFLFVALPAFLGCSSTPGPPHGVPVQKPVSITRFPAPLEDSLIEADYIPWDLAWKEVHPGDVLKEAAPSLRTIWPAQDCFETLPSSAPQPDRGLVIQTVSLSAHDLTGGLSFLNLAGAEFEKHGISGAQIRLTNLSVQDVPEGHVQPSRARAGSQCASDLASSHAFFPVAAVLYGRIDLQLYSQRDEGGRLHVSPESVQDLGLEAKGYRYSGSSKSWVSEQRILLGVRAAGRTAKDVRQRLREGVGILKRPLDEEIERSYDFFTDQEWAFVKLMPRILKDLEDIDHTLRYDVVELLLDDVDFSLKEYTGRSIAGLEKPLKLLGFAANQTRSHRLFKDGDPSKELSRVRSWKYGGATVHDVHVGTSDFHITHAQYDFGSFCGDERPYDFLYLNLVRRFRNLEGLTFVLLVHRDRMGTLPKVVELELRNGIFRPAFGSEFVMDNLHTTYGSEAFRKYFDSTVDLLKKTFPGEDRLKELKRDDFVGYRVNLLPRHDFAIAFHCPTMRNGEMMRP